MRDIIKKILKEETQEWEYQIRYIDGPVFYKRKKGETKWSFTTDKEFAENAYKCKVVKWEKGEKSD